MSTATVPQAFARALQHHQAGRLVDAEVIYRQVLAAQPDHAAAWSNLGAALADLGRIEEAIPAFRRALELEPHQPEAHNNLAGVLARRGRLDEAVDAYRRALQIRPDYVEVLDNLGNALRRRGQFEEAIAAHRRALELQPGYADAWNNLGLALAGQGRIEEATAAYRRALALRPDGVEAWNNLGIALAATGRLDEARAAYRQALALRPGFAEAHVNLGDAFSRQDLPDPAIEQYRRALALQPDRAEAHNNLGNALKDQGRLDEAIAAYRRALEIRPGYVEAHSNLLLAQLYHPARDRAAIRAEQQCWEQQHAQPLRRFFAPHPNLPDPVRPLRIGYVSPDFRDNMVGRNLAPLLRFHDSRKFTVICYSGAARPDALTEEFRQRARAWRETVGLRDERLAEMIREDGIDILVDLTLHAAGNRLPVFARQPAPVQVSFAGYPQATALEAIGYRLSDRWLEREPGDGKVCFLESFWCYDPCGLEVEVRALPAGLSGHVTFGCLNNFCKVNEPVLQLWARVLLAVPDSRLILRSAVGSHRERTLELLQHAGVEAHRVQFVERLSRRAYLELYHGIDLALDPFPYGGHTTSLDALWMGVPVVSLAGDSSLARGGFSQWSNLGLPELAAFSPEDYVQIAAQWAGDWPRLAELRRTLRARMQASPLMDGPRFARQVEAAWRTLWRRWCAGARKVSGF